MYLAPPPFCFWVPSLSYYCEPRDQFQAGRLKTRCSLGYAPPPPPSWTHLGWPPRPHGKDKRYTASQWMSTFRKARKQKALSMISTIQKYRSKMYYPYVIIPSSLSLRVMSTFLLFYIFLLPINFFLLPFVGSIPTDFPPARPPQCFLFLLTSLNKMGIIFIYLTCTLKFSHVSG